MIFKRLNEAIVCCLHNFTLAHWKVLCFILEGTRIISLYYFAQCITVDQKKNPDLLDAHAIPISQMM